MSDHDSPAAPARPAANRPLSPFVAAALAAHVAAPPLLWAAPSTLAGVAAALVALNLTGFVAGLLPRSRLLGPNLTACARRHPQTGEPAVALTFDDGPDPRATPEALDLLAGAGARATFFCIGERAAAHPELVRRISAGGHRIENHTFTHPLHFAWLGPRGLAREIDRAQEVLGELADRAPRLLRAPAGIRSPLLQPLLSRRGLRLASWSRRGYDAVHDDPRAILRRLTRDLRPGEVLLLHDGRAHGSARRGRRLPVLEVLPALLAELERRGLRTTLLEAPDS
ncbi:MAG: polysaccharide deacetylase family protein [Acidobacteria bacterium]|nr:MAG: polysaccharide deacetylase family protein [Acidobacteriota bacterium]REK07109.1 MAG: polysaccharide deacetylase family protein [Acidobacteriota bacterium]